jgi:beta-glucosidase
MAGIPHRLLDPAWLAALPEAQRGFMQAMADEFRALLPAAGLPTCFPPGITMASTWDPDLVGACAAAVADEAKAFGVGMVLGPNVNIHRNPLGGRIFDPYLAGRIAVGYVQGMQARGVAADPKHFAANNQETNRQRINEHIPERALREIYLPAFRAAVEEGGAWTVMSAYNKINGYDCAMNRWLLTDLLRGEWGFEGFVVSDWGAAYDRIEALLAGNDLEMPGPQDPRVVIEAVESGRLPEAVLDERVANILGVWARIPAFEPERRPPLDRAASVRAATAIARDGAVLLKNEGGVLPLTRKGKIGVVGPNAANPYSTGGGSAGIASPYKVSLFEGLDARYGHATADGGVEYGDIPEGAVAVVVAAGVNSSEGADRATWDLPGSDVTLIHDTAARCRMLGIPCIVVLNVCGPVEMASWVDEVDAVLLLWLGGQELGHAAAALIAGDANPSGKLVTSWPVRYEDVPSAINWPGEAGEVWYGEGLFVGYRYYDRAGVEPLYPFGHGLSYTTFGLSNLRLSAQQMDLDRGDALAVSVDVTNTGRVAGSEVVQAYVADPQSTLLKPPKELKGFRKVALAPGQTETVVFTLDRRALEHWDPTEHAWVVEPGEFRVLVGTSAADTPLAAAFTATGENPYGYGPRTTLGRLMAEPQAMNVVMGTVVQAGGTLPTEFLMATMLAPLRPLGEVVPGLLAAAMPDATDERRAEVAAAIWEGLKGI